MFYTGKAERKHLFFAFIESFSEKLAKEPWFLFEIISSAV